MRRRRIFKYTKLHYFFLSYIVEFIILLLVNFIPKKSLTYWTNVHSYFENGNKYISAYKSQFFKEVYDFMLGHTHSSAGPHAVRGSRAGQPWSRISLYRQVILFWIMKNLMILIYIICIYLNHILNCDK